MKLMSPESKSEATLSILKPWLVWPLKYLSQTRRSIPTPMGYSQQRETVDREYRDQGKGILNSAAYSKPTRYNASRIAFISHPFTIRDFSTRYSPAVPFP